MKIVVHYWARIIFFDRLKYRGISSEAYKTQKHLINFVYAIYCSFVGFVFTYPLDLAYTRIVAHIERGSDNKLYSKFSEVIKRSVINLHAHDSFFVKRYKRISRYYKGGLYSILSSSVHSGILLGGTAVIYDEVARNKELYAVILGVVASVITYPLNTVMKRAQVEGEIGFRPMGKNPFANLNLLYRGFACHAVRSVPLSLLQFYSYRFLVRNSDL